MATHRILGISIGTKRIGFAVLENNQIVEWKIKGFDASWSQEKLEAIIAYIEHYTIVHSIRAIGVKVPAPHSQTAALTQIIKRLEHLGKTKKVPLYSYTLSDIKLRWSGQHRITIKQLIQTILEKHPKFHKEYSRMLRTKTVHFEKMFEAIGVVHLVQ